MRRGNALIMMFVFIITTLHAQEKVPYNLIVEFIRQPQNVEILDSQPEFSWAVPVKSVKQTGYQILVATTKQKLNEQQADVWNSGKIESSNSTEIEYNAGHLSPNTRYFWKVRVWDINNKPGEYSSIQEFTTGIFKGYQTSSNRFMSIFIQPKVFNKISANHYFIDFGKDAFGTLVLKIKPIKKDSITILLGEKLSTKNTIDTLPGGTIRYAKIKIAIEPGKMEYKIQLKPDERNTGLAAIHLPDSIGVVMPFRYCEIENCNIELKAENVFQNAFWYNWDYNSIDFLSSDSILNQVWELCKHSIKATSFCGIYIDGDRERIPYEADAYINQLGHYCLDNEYSEARKTNEYFIKHPTWPTEWILCTTLLFYNDYMYTGNLESIKHFYRELKYKCLVDLACEDGLISSKNVTDSFVIKLGFTDPKARLKDIIDWPPAQKDSWMPLVQPEGERDGYVFGEINTVVNCFFYRNLQIMSEFAGLLNNKKDSIYYSDLAQKVKKSINEKLLDKTKGIYLDGENINHSSLHANMFALAFELVPFEYQKSVLSFIKTRGMACSVYGAQFLLEALYNANEADYALSLLTSTNNRSWWNMIRYGSTITMEAWGMEHKPNSDINHAWGAAPANIITRNLWGIIPVLPGFEKASIKPQLSNLKYSKISVPTIRGSIVAEYSKKDNTSFYHITLPANINCDFVVVENPNKKITQIKLNDKPVIPEQGLIHLGVMNNQIKITWENK